MISFRKPKTADVDRILELIESNSNVLAPNNRMIYYLCCTIFSELSLLIERDKTLIGFAAVLTDSNNKITWIHQLAIAYNFRKLGYASALLKKIEGNIRNDYTSINSIKLAVKSDNYPAKSLYAKLDYELKEFDNTINMEIYEKKII